MKCEIYDLVTNVAFVAFVACSIGMCATGDNASAWGALACALIISRTRLGGAV